MSKSLSFLFNRWVERGLDDEGSVLIVSTSVHGLGNFSDFVRS